MVANAWFGAWLVVVATGVAVGTGFGAFADSSLAWRDDTSTICDGDVMGPLAVATCDGIVIGPSTIVGGATTGTLDVVGVLGETVMLGETAMLEASAYGSIGRISPDGPAYRDAPTSMIGEPYGSMGIAEPEGPAVDARAGRVAIAGRATSGPELDARGNTFAFGRVSNHGETSQRPAA